MMKSGAINLGSPLNRSHPLARGLVSFWLPLQNTTGGGTLYDIAGRNHGTLTNGPTWSTGQNGFGALSFTAASQHHVTTGYSATDAGNFTAATIFKPVGANAAFARLLTQKYDTAFWTGTNNGTTWGGGIRQGGSPFGLFVALPTSASVWYCLLMSRAGSTQTVSVVGDGGQNTSTQACDTGTLSGNNIYIGRETGDAAYFNGLIPAVFYWSGVGHDALVARWVFQEFRQGFPTLLNYLPRRVYASAGGAAPTTNRRRRLLCARAA